MIYVVCRYLYLSRSGKLEATRPRYEKNLYLLCLTLAVVFYLTLDSDLSCRSWDEIFDAKWYNFKPFAAFERLADLSGEAFEYYFAVNILGNVALFVPIGWLFGAVTENGVASSTFFGFCISLTVETLQVFLPRTTDVDDIILNTSGAFVGALLCALIKKKRPQKYAGCAAAKAKTKKEPPRRKT